MPNLPRALPASPSFRGRRASAARRFAITVAVDLAALLFTAGCAGAAPPAEAPSPGMMSAAAEAAPSPPPPSPSPQAQPPGAYPPPGAPGEAADMPAAYMAQPAPAAAPAPQSPSNRAPAAKSAPPPAKPAAPPGKTAPPPTGKPGEPSPPATTAQAPSVPIAPLLIYVGDLQELVPEPEAIAPTIDKVIDIAEGLGGYLAGRKDTSVQVRIPSMRFREGFTMLEKLAEVTHRSVTADDVSEQYSDLEVRLQNLRATHKRLQEFLSKAGNVQDMLTVGRELERVAGEIEAIEGKMRFLRSRAAFSLVTVGFQVKPKAVVVVATKVEVPPPRQVSLPIGWLPRVGLDTLLNLN